MRVKSSIQSHKHSTGDKSNRSAFTTHPYKHSDIILVSSQPNSSLSSLCPQPTAPLCDHKTCQSQCRHFFSIISWICPLKISHIYNLYLAVSFPTYYCFYHPLSYKSLSHSYTVKGCIPVTSYGWHRVPVVTDSRVDSEYEHMGGSSQGLPHWSWAGDLSFTVFSVLLCKVVFTWWCRKPKSTITEISVIVSVIVSTAMASCT